MQEPWFLILRIEFRIFLVLLDFSGKWTKRYWNFAVYLLEKRRWKITVHLPFALLPYGLFAGIIP